VALASIAQDLRGLSQKLGLSSDLLMLENVWDRELGRMSQFARISAIEKACLVVEADSSAVMQEISLRRQELVRKINKHFPVPFIQHITVRISQHHGR